MTNRIRIFHHCVVPLADLLLVATSTQWQRGLALYYAGRFAEGSEQFGTNVGGNPADVEEVVWRCCCDARQLGLGVARTRFMTPPRPDPRPAMAEILAMFHTDGMEGAAAVLDAGSAAEDGGVALAYGNFYIGLYLDACCGNVAAALEHFAKAAARPPNDYMGKMFVLHHRLAVNAVATSVGQTPLGDGYSHSRVILGGWQLSAGHHDTFSREGSLGSMSEHLRHGVGTLDCGDIYTGVEELIGAHLDRLRSLDLPAAAQVHTKLVPDLSRLESVDEHYCRTVLLRSRNRLGYLGPLDLVQFHWWDWAVGDHVAAYGQLCRLKAEGLVRNVGLTNYDASHTRELLDAGHPVAVNQIQYSLLDRRVERALVPLCLERGVSLLCYGVLGGGFLTDAWLGQPEPSAEQLENRSLVKYKLVVDEAGGWKTLQAVLGVLRGVADRKGSGATVADVAISWVLSRPSVGAVILGARNDRHLPSTIRAASMTLDADDLATIEASLTASTTPPGAVFELERDREGPHGRIMRYELNRVHTPTHVAELAARVDAHVTGCHQRWPALSDRAAYAKLLWEEIDTFGSVEVGDADRELLKAMKTRLQPFVS